MTCRCHRLRHRASARWLARCRARRFSIHGIPVLGPRFLPRPVAPHHTTTASCTPPSAIRSAPPWHWRSRPRHSPRKPGGARKKQGGGDGRVAGKPVRSGMPAKSRARELCERLPVGVANGAGHLVGVPGAGKRQIVIPGIIAAAILSRMASPPGGGGRCASGCERGSPSPVPAADRPAPASGTVSRDSAHRRWPGVVRSSGH